MGVLPSGYIPVNELGSKYNGTSSTNAYFDTGVVPKDTLKIESVFRMPEASTGSAYWFGARNSNSNTSNGQLWFGLSSNLYPQVGYYNAQTTLISQVMYYYFFGKSENELTVFGRGANKTLVGSENAFTGSRNMYILARNNGGSVQFGSALSTRAVRGVRIYDDDVLIKEFLPAFEEASGKYGLYETVSGTFNLKTGGTNDYETMKMFTVVSTDGGDAFIDDDRFGTIKQIMVYTDISNLPVRLKAVAKSGYVFNYWEANGVILSREEEFLYKGEDTEEAPAVFADDITAHFVKKTAIVQDNGFRAMTFKYGAAAEGEYYPSSNTYAKVVSASIVEDIMNRATTTIVLDKMPSTIALNVPIILTDQLNKELFIGIVKGISGNTLTVHEPLSVLNTDFVLDTMFDFGIYPIQDYVYRIGSQIINGVLGLNVPLDQNWFVVKKWSSFWFDTDSDLIYLDGAMNYLSNAPSVADTSVVNAEDYLFELCNNYNIIVKPTYTPNREFNAMGWLGQAVVLTVANPNALSKITFGDNSEELSDVVVEVEEAENTVLQVYNADGTTFRGVWGVKNDGTIAKYVSSSTFPEDLHDFIGSENCKLKVVASDEQVSLLKKQYLSNSFLNHKITFRVDLTKGTFRLEDFTLGRPVDFYYGNRLFRSMVTAREFEIAQNHDEITSVFVTLGKVRTALTSKMNLRKSG